MENTNQKSPTHVSTDFVPEKFKENFTENKKYKVKHDLGSAVLITDDTGEQICVKYVKGGFFSQYCNILGEGKLWKTHYEGEK